MTRRMAAAILATAAAATVLTGCTSNANQPGNPPPTASAATGQSPAPTPPATEAPDDAAPVLPDGRSPVFLTSIDVGGRKITFDLIVMYRGADAEKQWLKDHPGQTEAPALNGHYIVNNNPKLRTLPVSTNAVVKVVPDGNPSKPTTIPISQLPGYRGALAGTPFWITVTAGVITGIEEEFLS